MIARSLAELFTATPSVTSLVLVLAGCAGARHEAGSTEREERAGEPTASGSQPEAEVREATPAVDVPCAERVAYADCRVGGGCVWASACRDPADACELVRVEPVFDDGDPCERAQPGCAWSTARGRCVPFAAVPACPATLAEASAQAVQCDHSGQVALECRYGDTRCACERTVYCGGAPPPPELEYPAAIFACVAPLDARGCPTGGVREGSRCTTDPNVRCEACSWMAQCVRGRWRVEQLPPRP